MRKFLNENYKTFIYSIVILIVLLYPMPYYISNGGGISDLNDKFKIEDGYKSKGSFNLSYVTQLDATLSSYMLSYVIPNWEREEASLYQYNEEESMEDINNRGKLQLQRANQNSVILAYTKANREITINSKKYYIAYLFNNDIKNIKVGDEVLAVNDKKIDNLESLKEEITNSDIVKVTVKRNDKEYTEEVKPIIENGVKYIGLSFFETYDYTVNPEISFSFDLNESGSSAGLMTTLAIYNALIPEDLTHGKKIAGTGSISLDGTVSEIGGVEYKLLGAVYGKADIFFVPKGENFDDCIRLKKEKNYDIEVVGVSTIDDAINYLKNLK